MSNVRRSDRRSAEALRMAMVPSQLSALILFAIILTGSVGKLRAADDVKPEPPVGQVREEHGLKRSECLIGFRSGGTV